MFLLPYAPCLVNKAAKQGVVSEMVSIMTQVNIALWQRALQQDWDACLALTIPQHRS